MWKHMLVGLRIKQRIDGYAVEGEDNNEIEKFEEAGMDTDDSDEYVDENGGGFFPSHDGGGGFLLE
jgi:xeroderma pigmentosum group C-complementing protein